MKNFLIASVLIFSALLAPGETLRIAGTRVFLPAIAEAARVLQEERGFEIAINTDGGSEAGVAALAQKQVRIAMCGRHVTAEERALAPAMDFHEIEIGRHAVALAVSGEVWRGGVIALSRGQVRDIYESRITNWKSLRGPDEKITFFNRAEGRGTWEIFAQWLYGSVNKAPGTNFDTISTDEDAREAVAKTPGAITQIAVLIPDYRALFPLSLQNEDGSRVAPTLQNIANEKYPMSHPLFLVTNDRPTQEAKIFVDFILGPRGQEIMRRHGFVPEADLIKAKTQ